MNVRHALALLCLPFFCSIALILTGCESDGGASSSDFFYIDPDEVSLTVDQDSAVLNVVGGIGPYSWDVSSSNLGTIVVSGETVTYTRTTATGANMIEVRDSNGWLASAVINQLGQADELTIDVAPGSLGGDGDIAVITISGGRAPYSWSVSDVTLGDFLPGNRTAASRLYARTRAGNNAISVEDAGGSVVHVVISQP